MKITCITVGKVKESFYREAIEAYVKEISRFATFENIEVADEKAPENLSEKEMLKIKSLEGERIISKIPERAHVVALAIEGKFANELTVKRLFKKEDLCFIIGGSLGLSDAVIHRANDLISFGAATFPHQLMKVMLLATLDKQKEVATNLKN